MPPVVGARYRLTADRDDTRAEAGWQHDAVAVGGTAGEVTVRARTGAGETLAGPRHRATRERRRRHATHDSGAAAEKGTAIHSI